MSGVDMLKWLLFGFIIIWIVLEARMMSGLIGRERGLPCLEYHCQIKQQKTKSLRKEIGT